MSKAILVSIDNGADPDLILVLIQALRNAPVTYEIIDKDDWHSSESCKETGQ